MEVKLNIGCGGKIMSGFVNIDCRKLPGVDKTIDLEKENLPYEDNSVIEIWLQDFLEHLSKFRQRSFLEEIYRILSLKGKVFIQLPDLEVIAKRYCGLINNPPMQHSIDAEAMASLLYGGQDYETNFHKWGYDQSSLRKILEEIGFRVLDCHSDGGSNLLCWAEKSI